MHFGIGIKSVNQFDGLAGLVNSNKTENFRKYFFETQHVNSYKLAFTAPINIKINLPGSFEVGNTGSPSGSKTNPHSQPFGDVMDSDGDHQQHYPLPMTALNLLDIALLFIALRYKVTISCLPFGWL